MKNFKFSILLISLVCGTLYTGAKQVDEASAKKVGSNFLISERVAGVNSPSDLTTAYIAKGDANGTAITDYYVFNINGGKGFVMVSGDDAIIPILAFSNTSLFDINKIADGTRSWIMGYKNQITASVAENLPAETGAAQEWAKYQNVVAQNKANERTTVTFPLLATSWDQYPYYDNLCPTDFSSVSGDNHDVTGCVATAIAQIMKFWNFPSVGTGFHAYGTTSHGTLAANFGTTAYNWTNMPNTVGSTTSAAGKAAVATLMYHAGVAVNMQYTSAESGAYTIDLESPIINCAEYAFKTYFHYKRSLKGIPRFGEYYTGSGTPDSMVTSAWISMLQTELNAGRPMLYSGGGTSGGHAWVCDGWQTSSGTKFHFNWGWSGQSDGYYTVNNLHPPALGTGAGSGDFNSDQCVILGIQPDTYPSTSGNIKMQSFLTTATNCPMHFGTPISYTAKIFNANSTTFTGDICAQVFDTSNHLIGTIQTLTGQNIPANDSSATLSFGSLAMLAMVPKVLYNVQLMYRTSSSNAWTPVASNGTFLNYAAMDVANDTDISVFSTIALSPSAPVRQGRALTVTADVLDKGASNFSGAIEAVLINIATGTSYPVQVLTGQSIFYGYSNTYTFSTGAVTAPLGAYVLEILHQYNGAGSFYTTGNRYYQNPILVSVVSPVSVPGVNPAEEIIVYPNPANDVIYVGKSGYQVSSIELVDLQGRTVKTMTPDQTQSTVSIPTSDIAGGMYIIQIHTESGLVSKKVMINNK